MLRCSLDTHTDIQIQGFEPNQFSGAGGSFCLDTSGASGSFLLLQILCTVFAQTTSPAVVTVGGSRSFVYRLRSDESSYDLEPLVRLFRLQNCQKNP